MHPTRALITAALVGCTTAVSATNWESPDRLARAAERAASASGAPDSTIKVHAQVDPRLKLPACGHYPKTRAPQSLRGTAVTVEVQCSQPSPWKLYVPVKVQQFAQVLVLSRAVQRGDTIRADMLSLQQRDLARLPYGYITQTSQAVGQQSKRHLMPGAAIRPQDLSARQLIRRGQQVTLVGRINGLEIRMSGKALADGQLQQRIRVENLSSRKVVEAVVRSAQEVEVLL